ncbi:MULTISPECIES: M15 family metallopeptidase [unclassified Acinetobacter]|uniref:M15 family metallopeptidase n=1 Tax=unclassified Acinetobacter TaxID=196816 RepID=UPI00211E8ED2|nr:MULTISPECIES: M15 family metallopeptidase [unclassified Acinetobacter]
MLITMSDKEIQRLAVLQDVRDHRITQVRAAEILNLSTRQITRLLQKLNQDGVSGMAHASRGQPGHRRHDDLLKSKCLSIISEHLLGFGPTLAFGLAADIAFKRHGKVVITERDPWAMRGYELYGQVAESVGLTWGGRWKSIKDFGHTEYRMPGLKKTAEMAHQLIHEGQLQVHTLHP